MLEVDAQRRFGAFQLDARFTAGAGLTALFGRSGAGKTLLVNMLAGLERPREGRIVIDGRVLFDSAGNIDLPPERRRLGYVFQEARLFPHLSVKGNLTYGMGRMAPARRRGELDGIVTLLDIAPLLTRRPGSLSGGEKQRVAIGRALLAAPSLLLMDEPLASLDVARKNEILPYIERLRDDMGLPIVYVSHAIDEVIRLADTMVVISGGQAVATGTVEAVMSRLDLRPLTGRYEAGAVLSVTVAGRDKTFGLTELVFAGRRLRVPGEDLAMGTRLRLRVRARDVSLSLDRPANISVLNILEARVTQIEDTPGPQVDVLLDVGAPLIARITRRSVVELGLAPGKAVHALIKAVAIDRHSLGGRGPDHR